MAFVYPAVAIAAGDLGPNRVRRAPKLYSANHVYLTKIEFLSTRLPCEF